MQRGTRNYGIFYEIYGRIWRLPVIGAFPLLLSFIILKQVGLGLLPSSVAFNLLSAMSIISPNLSQHATTMAGSSNPADLSNYPVFIIAASLLCIAPLIPALRIFVRLSAVPPIPIKHVFPIMLIAAFVFYFGEVSDAGYMRYRGPSIRSLQLDSFGFYYVQRLLFIFVYGAAFVVTAIAVLHLVRRRVSQTDQSVDRRA